MCHKPSEKSISGRARTGPWLFSFLSEHATSHDQSAVDKLYGCFVLNILRSSSETPSEGASCCTMLRHKGKSRTNSSLSLEFRATQAHPQLKTRSFASKQLGFCHGHKHFERSSWNWFGFAKIALMELLVPLAQLGNNRRRRRTDEVQPYSKEERAGGGPASKENTKHIVGSLHNGT